MFRAIAALCVLIPALVLLQLAYAICPELKKGARALPAQEGQDGPWLDSPSDWDARVH